MSLTKTQLNQAFREVVAEEFADVPCEMQITFAFSDRFVKKMDKMIVQQKKSYWTYVNTAKKRVAIAVILLLSTFMVALSNEEVRASMLQWCEKVYEKYIHYYFEGETTKKIEHKYQLTVIPEGFEVVYEYSDIESVTTSCENKDGKYILLEQYVTEQHNYFIDNENMKWSNIRVDEIEVKIYEHSDLMGAIWIKDGYFMSLSYYGCDNIDVIKEMISNIE